MIRLHEVHSWEALDIERCMWKRVQRAGGGHTAVVSCPQCGGLFVLSKHTIGDDGVVTPSVVAPSGKHEPLAEMEQKIPPEFTVLHRECGFHDYVILEGWKP
jgi:hypothetical protein